MCDIFWVYSCTHEYKNLKFKIFVDRRCYQAGQDVLKMFLSVHIQLYLLQHFTVLWSVFFETILVPFFLGLETIHSKPRPWHFQCFRHFARSPPNHTAPAPGLCSSNFLFLCKWNQVCVFVHCDHLFWAQIEMRKKISETQSLPVICLERIQSSANHRTIYVCSRKILQVECPVPRLKEPNGFELHADLKMLFKWQPAGAFPSQKKPCLLTQRRNNPARESWRLKDPADPSSLSVRHKFTCQKLNVLTMPRICSVRRYCCGVNA